jgi:hypothetical protein
MDLRAIVRAMGRQLPVVLVVAVLTVFVALRAADDTQTHYEGKASLLFVSSPSSYDQQGKAIAVNPLNLSGNGELVASAAVLAMSKSPGFEDQLRANGASTEVKFRRVADAILEVKAQAPTPTGALETLTVAQKLVSDQLAASQAAAGAPLGTYLKIETLASTDRARAIESSPMKSVGAIVVVGIVIAVALAMALDAIAPHGFRSMVRGVVGLGRGVVGLGRGVFGRLALPDPSRGASIPRPGPPAPPPAAPPPTRVEPVAPAEPVATPERAERAPGGPGTPVPVPNTGNRQTRREAARAASRPRGSDAGGPSRPSRPA